MSHPSTPSTTRSIEWGGRKRHRLAITALAALAVVGVSFAAPRSTGSSNAAAFSAIEISDAGATVDASMTSEVSAAFQRVDATTSRSVRWS